MTTRTQQLKKHIGGIVHKHRIRSGFSLRQLANETDISYSTIFAIEEGRGEVTMPRLRMLARVLGNGLLDETVAYLGNGRRG